ncbi:hypothetical protein JCM19992_05220 [Thermostilla marina]
MKRTRWLWFSGLVLLAIPYGVLIVAGGYWCYRQGWLWLYLAVSAAITAVGWALLSLGKRGSTAPLPQNREPPEGWPPHDREVWKVVDELAVQAEHDTFPLNSPEDAWKLLSRVLETVAKEYYPDSKTPTLETPLPDVLRIVEKVAAELREVLERRVPGAHIVRMGDFERMRHLSSMGERFYFAYRIFRFIVSPGSGILAEAQRSAASAGLRRSVEELRRWAIGFAVRRIGYYAIELYSGRALIEHDSLKSYAPAEDRKAVAKARRLDVEETAAPLRVLVVGPRGAGKTSLIFAICGTPWPTDDIPPTARVDHYVVQREDFGRLLLIDTPGFDRTDRRDPFARWKKEVLSADLILLVCPANSAVSGPQQRFLTELRGFFACNPKRLQPPVVVALTHIDRLPPEDEWSPPYAFEAPLCEKEHSVSREVDRWATIFEMEREAIAPVCTHPDRVYNLEDSPDSLTAAIGHVLHQAYRVRRLRATAALRREQRWAQTKTQITEGGRMLVELGSRYLFGRRKKRRTRPPVEPPIRPTSPDSPSPPRDDIVDAP